MAKNTSIPNAFASQSGSIPLSELDQNFNTISTSLLSANGYNNYGTETGAADAYVVSLSPATATLAAGLQVSFIATAANTGPSTLNVNSLGVKNILSSQGAALTGGEIAAGGIVNVIYDGTAWQLVGSGGGGAEGGGFLYENTQTLTSNYTITTGKNAGSFGPVSIATGVTLTVPTGSVWTVV